MLKGFSFDAEGENENPYRGLLVDQVESDSPASRAQLQPGDVVYEVCGARTATMNDLVAIIRDRIVGDVLDVYGERDGEVLELAIMIGGRNVPYEQVENLRNIILAALDEEE